MATACLTPQSACSLAHASPDQAKLATCQNSKDPVGRRYSEVTGPLHQRRGNKNGPMRVPNRTAKTPAHPPRTTSPHPPPTHHPPYPPPTHTHPYHPPPPHPPNHHPPPTTHHPPPNPAGWACAGPESHRKTAEGRVTACARVPFTTGFEWGVLPHVQLPLCIGTWRPS